MSRSRNYQKSRKSWDEIVEILNLQKVEEEAVAVNPDDMFVFEPDEPESTFVRSCLGRFDGVSNFMVEFIDGAACIVPLQHS